ncbi:CaiB/BaiF CoA transferase family protein [Halobacillus ihumii]|uniref:CaiB/BaiF CoA transferase family protein n=1 Tax=Halobacillus ihumii TaxID=2686092 RepID=UPI0013D65079|nr:CaiB/BaiF CoA-transferase family protein [Halobacillus ihumii]
MNQPLEDIRILDLSRVYAAPAGSMILADLGADVIRVESLTGSDSMREWGPFVNGESTYYFSSNRNKRSITLNLKEEKGKDVFLDLVKKADVVLENFKTGTMEKLGLGYEYLKTVNDQLIMCSVTGFGQTGPDKGAPGFDPVIQAISGLMDVTGDADGEPTKVGVPIADILTSNYVALSILSAIRMRDFNNQGQHIDLSLLDVQISSLANVSSGYLNAGKISKRVGNSHNNVVPYQVFRCKDDPIMLCAGNNGLYVKLCKLLNHPEWATDPRYCTNDKRLENEEELVSKIQQVMKKKTADEWMELLSQAKIPAGKVNTIDQAFDHPQVQARESVEVLTHPIVGEIKMTKNPMRFSDLNISSKYAPPLLGEHTEELLMEELGYSMEELDELRKQHVISYTAFDKIVDG